MAIELIKNNGAGISAPVKTHRTQGVSEKSFELTLSDARAVTTTSELGAVNRADGVDFRNTLTELKTKFGSSRESSIDNERVMRIKQEIENGTYKINPDRIAAKMMQFDFL